MGTGASVMTIFCHSCGTRTRGDRVCLTCGSTVVEQTDGRFPVGEGADAMVATVESITVVADSVDEDNGLLLRVAPRLVYRPLPEEEDDVPLSPAAKSLVDRLVVSPYCCTKKSFDETCVICSTILQEDTEAVTLPCKHTYHTLCIKTWLEAQHTCPTCRYELEVDDGVYLRSIGLSEQARVIDAAKMRQAKICADNEAEERSRWWRAMCRGLPVHFGVQCALCKQTPVVGTTYHCCLCENVQTPNGVYLCEDCYGLEVPNTDEAHHEGEHLFLPVRTPATSYQEEENTTAEAAYMAVRSLALAPLERVVRRF
eukprot:GEMP01053570.1.p1 GENE.GEMP01053570.1~~GEMP01053570.1.p1  ORF type:complete len:313 (-),score=71.00 GEMP01053570.1:164-1102(-)